MEGGGGRVKFLSRAGLVRGKSTDGLSTRNHLCSTSTGCFFFTGPPPEKFKYGKLRLGVPKTS